MREMMQKFKKYIEKGGRGVESRRKNKEYRISMGRKEIEIVKNYFS